MSGPPKSTASGSTASGSTASGSTASRSAAERYCAAVNAKDAAALGDLFATDAVALNTVGEFRGRDEILGFYTGLVFANDVTVVPVAVYEAGDTCVVELEGRTPNGPDVQRMVDIFTVDGDGRVVRLAIYRR
jgi:ketosteroid isomerase-like protein